MDEPSAGIPPASDGPDGPADDDARDAPLLDAARLAAVRATGLLDTGPDETFDRLARLAASLLDAPFAFVTLVDDRRSFWKAAIGVESEDPADRQNTVEESFCQYVVASGRPLVSGDVTADPLTAANPSIATMGVRAWAGQPLRDADGQVLGTFCVVDTRTREWSERDVAILEVLARAAGSEVAVRSTARHLTRPDAEPGRPAPVGPPDAPATDVPAVRTDARGDVTLLEQALSEVADGVLVLDRAWTIRYVNEAGAQILERPAEEVVGRDVWELYPEAVGGDFWEAYQRAVAKQVPTRVDTYVADRDSWLEARALPHRDGLTVFFCDATEQRRHEAAQSALVTELQDSLTRSRALLSLSEALAGARAVREVADAVAEVLREATGAVFSGIALLQPSRRRLRFVSLSPLPAGTEAAWTEFPLNLEAPPSAAVRRNRPYFHPDRSAAVADFPDLGPHMDTAGAAALAHLPLPGSTQTLGTLALTWAEEHPFSPEEVGFLLTAAGLAGQALERALLAEEQTTVLHRLQEALLPQDLPQGSIGVEALYRPAGQVAVVGGDWYDAFHVADGSITLFVGDVAGHGVEAATAMAQLRHATRIFALEDPDPSQVLSRLNRLVAAATFPHYATAACLTLDPAVRRIRYASAGHPSPLLLPGEDLDPDHRTVGPMLGVFDDSQYRSSVHDLPVGSALLLFTDGLVERPGVSITEGVARLRESAGSLVAAAQAGRAREGLAEMVDAMVIPQDRRDDICALLVYDRVESVATAGP